VIVVLTGGTGGAKFVEGLSRVLSPKELTVIVNTGDDLTWWGLHVSPDLDSITYALAGKLSKERGWGVEGDTFRCLEAMRRLGAPDWFQLGDLDLATHLTRTSLLSAGKTLTQATAEIAISYGVKSQVLPMTDDRVETRVRTEDSELLFQEYFVRERYQPNVCGVRFAGAGEATPTDAVLGAIADAETIFVAPSNPITSIGPILAVPGIRKALTETSASVAAISPIVNGAAVSGPAAALMQAQGLPPSIAGVAEAYGDFLNVLVVDESDRKAASELNRANLEIRCTNTVMKSAQDKASLARAALSFIRQVTSQPCC
jgi:LPPG:FO 2-phospho-L-lactate transferase